MPLTALILCLPALADAPACPPVVAATLPVPPCRALHRPEGELGPSAPPGRGHLNAFHQAPIPQDHAHNHLPSPASAVERDDRAFHRSFDAARFPGHVWPAPANQNASTRTSLRDQPRRPIR
jgi:hypothetical protein